MPFVISEDMPSSPQLRLRLRLRLRPGRRGWARRARPAGAQAASVVLLLLAACKNDPAATGPKPCCEQPAIPSGVTPFKVVVDDAAGPSDGQKVALKVAMQGPIKRDQVYPVLHTLYRHAMKRAPFEPIQFTAAVFADEAAARAGDDGKALAVVSRGQSDLAPRCENRVPFDFTEQAERAFAGTIGRLPQRDEIADSCHLAQKKGAARPDEGFKHQPTIKVDASRRSVAVTYPYLEMGKDEYVKTLGLSGAMTYWTDLVTNLFRKVEGLQEVAYVGLWNDAPVLTIAITRPQFQSGFGGLQEEIAAHAAVTFQSLGLRKTDDRGALREQEAFKTKTYKTALAQLPKGQVSVSPKLK